MDEQKRPAFEDVLKKMTQVQIMDYIKLVKATIQNNRFASNHMIPVWTKGLEMANNELDNRKQKLN
ncbi:hypothetical protein VB264_05370 [Arcicella aquatica]|uniref:Uncharacterized protein n=1 Tax=Arcicella aquatica TaxID=217141 RepID=A0ABU5QJG6_9BACT|nr:hypothetical protein [Arcicella aquatica]MEA5257207.1 hypothetical protein [Arcicella aquatica]